MVIRSNVRSVHIIVLLLSWASAFAVSASAAGSFTMSAEPYYLEVPTGSSRNTTITLTSDSIFSGTVTLWGGIHIENGPDSSFNQSTVDLSPGGSASVNMTVTTTERTSLGTYYATALGQGESYLTSVTVKVKVVYGVFDRPNFNIVADKENVTVTPQTSAVFTFTLTSINDFSGPILLDDIPGLVPQGTFSLNPLTLSAGQSAVSSLTIPFGRCVREGESWLTLEASSGSIRHRLFLTIRMTGVFPDFCIKAVDVTVPEGAARVATVQIDSTGGFTGNITVSIQPDPPPVPIFLASNTTRALPYGSYVPVELVILAPQGISQGVYTATVEAENGTVTRSATVTVTVVGPRTGPDYRLTPSPNRLSLEPGDSSSSTISVTPLGGFRGEVRLSVISKLRVSFTPAMMVVPEGPYTSTMNLTVPADTALGDYSVLVYSVSTSGLIESAGLGNYAFVNVTVAAPGPPGPQESTSPLIFGLEPSLFYGMTLAGVVAVLISTFSFLKRSRNGERTQS